MIEFVKKIAITLFVLWFTNLNAQEFELKVTCIEKKDSLVLAKFQDVNKFTDALSLEKSFDNLIKKIQLAGYIDVQLLKSDIQNKEFIKVISLEKKYETILLTIKNNDITLENVLNSINIKKQTSVDFINIENYLLDISMQLDRLGYTFAVVKLNNLQKKENQIVGELDITLNEKRTISSFVIKGYTAFPVNYLKNISKKYSKKSFSKENVEKLYTELNTFRFSRQTKYPEILFTTDTTSVYLYLEKVKSNRFDGFMGITSNKEGKTILNGYLDLQLMNSFNRGEKISVYWKNNGEDQKTFSMAIELPYVLKTPFGLKGNLKLFTQDQTFQNTRLSTDLGYYFNFYSKLFIGYESNQSNDIQNSNNSVKSFKNSFWNTSFEYKSYLSKNQAIENISSFIKIGFGKRNALNQNSPQQNIEWLFEKNIWLHAKHIFNVRAENFLLLSNTYLVNELYRFGGINSIRGFNENSLQASQTHNLLTEYRFYFAPNSFIHSIIDYGYLNDKTTNQATTLKSFGIGLGLFTKNGVMRLIYANGSTNNQSVDINNSIVHVGFKSSF